MSTTAASLTTSGQNGGTGALAATASLPTLDGLDVRGKRVLLRVDYNIPAKADGSLFDDYRIASTLPTLKKLLIGGARVGILTHRGRPGGRVIPQLSTHPLAGMLSEMLGQPVRHVPDCVGRVAEQAMAELAPGEVLMFENVRFHLGEQLNQRPFVMELAKLGDVFVNDAFATAHRAHASTSGLAAAMRPSVIGCLMERELGWLRRMAGRGEHAPKAPVILVLGGHTVQSKMELLQHMLTRVDTVMLGGAIANTFMAARDLGMGQSVLDPSCVTQARDILTEAGVVGCRLHLPQDVWVHDASVPQKPSEVRATHQIGAQEAIVDIGPQTLATWQRLVVNSGTAILLGSLGVAESPDGRAGSLGLIESIVEQRGFSLVGGNGMLPLLHETGLKDRLSALSTGGAALLEGLLEKPFPALRMSGI